jgi:hypothetical protein
MAASLAAWMLDVLVARPPGAGSVTTLIPGTAYALATIMKVCLVTGLLSALIALCTRAFAKSGTRAGPSDSSGREFPGCAVASIALPPVAHIAGAAVIVALGHRATAGLSIGDFSRVSRTAVLVVLMLLVVAAFIAAISLARRDPPRLLAVIGLAMNAVLIGLFWYLEFYALGFDQDSWAPR